MERTAQRLARINVFHATPQRVLPVMHDIPQIFSVNSRLKNAASEKAPSLSCTAWMRIFNTGKNVKAVTSSVTVTTLPATNASPLNKPRSASPSENSIANAVATSVAPSPMPYWPTASVPSAFSDSNAKPRAPIAKPCANR